MRAAEGDALHFDKIRAPHPDKLRIPLHILDIVEIDKGQAEDCALPLEADLAHACQVPLPEIFKDGPINTLESFFGAGIDGGVELRDRR